MRLPQTLRLHVMDLTAVVSLGVVVFGLASTDVLAGVGWSTATIRPFWIIVGAAVLAVVAATLLAPRIRISIDALLGVALAVLAAVVFGLAAFAMVALLLLASLVSGSWLVRVFLSEDHDWAVAQRLSAGLALFAIILTLLSPFRVNFPAIHLGLLILGAAPLASNRIRARVLADLLYLREPTPDLGPLSILWRSLGVVIAIFFMLQAALPERYHDALAVHLYIASYMAAHGEWAYDPNLFVFAVMPMAADFVYAHLFLFGGEPAVKLFNYAALLVIAMLISGTTARRFGPMPAVLATLLFVSMPLTLIETASAFIENPLTMWITASASVIVSRGSRLRLGDICGVLLLLSAATLTKVHGGIASAVLGSAMLAIYLSNRRNGREVAGLVLAMGVAGMVALSTYAHAYLITGNPVFPFFNNIFKSPYYASVQFVDGRWIGRFKPDILYQATFASGNFLEAYNGAIGFSLAAFLAVGLLGVAIHRSQLRLVALAFLGFICAIGAGTQYLRYFYPVLPIAFILIGFALTLYLSRPYVKWLCQLAVALVVCLNLYKLPAAGWILGAYDFSALFDGQRARRYEQAFVPEKTLLRVVNDLAGRSSRVLLSGVSSATPLEGTALYTSWYSKEFSDFGATAKTIDDVETYLRRVKPTHILHRSPPEPSYPFHGVLDAGIERFGKRIAKMGSVSLYEVHLP
jgi:hypothetical protein